MKLVILIPAYNEVEVIRQVINTLPKNLLGITEIIPLVVDDGSKDDTAAIAAEAGAIVVRHPYNHGLGKAFSTGLTKALELGADVLVNIDADGQFNPNDIQALLDPILSGRADFVSGDRFSKIDGSLVHPEYMSRIKFWGNQRMSALVSMLARRRFVDVSCGFRAYSREAMLRLNLTGSFTYTQESFLDLANKGLAIEDRSGGRALLPPNVNPRWLEASLSMPGKPSEIILGLTGITALRFSVFWGCFRVP